MASRQWLVQEKGMASPWRRRPLCLLLADRPAPSALREINGAGALLETHLRPDIGSRVSLRHPDAGTIRGEVVAHDREGIRLAFDRSEAAVAFALAAITSDMSRPD
jgi:hypothetical protein